MSERLPIRMAQIKREPTLVRSGGGPHDPDMEMRVARLEGDFAAMRADVSYIRGRVESLPSAWQMMTAIVAGNVALAGLLFAVVKLFGHA